MPHSNVSEDDFFYEGRFPPNSTAQRQHIARLRDVCYECLAFDDCRAEVNRLRDFEGFWAGETADERRARWHREANPVRPIAAVTTRGRCKP